MCQWIKSSLVQLMACHLLSTKPLPEPMLTYCQLNPKEYISIFFFEIQELSFSKMYFDGLVQDISKYMVLSAMELLQSYTKPSIGKYLMQNGGHIVLASLSHIYVYINSTLIQRNAKIQWHIDESVSNLVTQHTEKCQSIVETNELTDSIPNFPSLPVFKYDTHLQFPISHSFGVDTQGRSRELHITVSPLWPHSLTKLTLKRLGHFFQNIILFSNVVQH